MDSRVIAGRLQGHKDLHGGESQSTMKQNSSDGCNIVFRLAQGFTPNAIIILILLLMFGITYKAGLTCKGLGLPRTFEVVAGAVGSFARREST